MSTCYSSGAPTVFAMDTQATPVETLQEMTRLEYWDVVRKVRPDLELEEFEAMWLQFCAWKRYKCLH